LGTWLLPDQLPPGAFDLKRTAHLRRLPNLNKQRSPPSRRSRDLRLFFGERDFGGIRRPAQSQPALRWKVIS